MVKPTRRKGSRINQTMGKRKNMTKANGQHKTNNMHRSKAAMNVFMMSFFSDSCN